MVIYLSIWHIKCIVIYDEDGAENVATVISKNTKYDVVVVRIYSTYGNLHEIFL